MAASATGAATRPAAPDFVREMEDANPPPVKKEKEPFCTYLDDLCPVSKTTFYVCTSLSIGQGAACGAAIGAPAGPPGIGIGAAVGALVGGLGWYKIIDIDRPRMRSLAEWKAITPSEEREEAIRDIKAMIGDKPDLCDPFTYEPLIDPVRTPNGRVYERAVLEAELKRSNNIDMITGRPLTISEVVPAYDIIGAVRKEMSRIAAAADTPVPCKKLSEAFKKQFQYEATQQFKKAEKDLRKMLDEGRISPDKYIAEMRRINDLMK